MNVSLFFCLSQTNKMPSVGEDNRLIHGFGITGIIQSIKGSVEKKYQGVCWGR